MKPFITLIAFIIAGFVVFGNLANRRPRDRTGFLESYPQVEKSKTVDEIQELLKRPPGWYASPQTTFSMQVEISGNVFRRGEILSWMSDECCILVRKKADGTVVRTWLVRPTQPPSLLKRMIMSIGE